MEVEGKWNKGRKVYRCGAFSQRSGTIPSRCGALPVSHLCLAPICVDGCQKLVTLWPNFQLRTVFFSVHGPWFARGNKDVWTRPFQRDKKRCTVVRYFAVICANVPVIRYKAYSYRWNDLAPGTSVIARRILRKYLFLYKRHKRPFSITGKAEKCAFCCGNNGQNEAASDLRATFFLMHPYNVFLSPS